MRGRPSPHPRIRAWAKWTWASISPGRSSPPRRSIVSSVENRRPSSRDLPTASTRRPRTATAPSRMIRRAASIVTMVAFLKSMGPLPERLTERLRGRRGRQPLMAENSVPSRVLYVASLPSTLTSTSEKVVFLALRAITSPSTMIIRIAGTSPNSMHPRPSLA